MQCLSQTLKRSNSLNNKVSIRLHTGTAQNQCLYVTGKMLLLCVHHTRHHQNFRKPAIVNQHCRSTALNSRNQSNPRYFFFKLRTNKSVAPQTAPADAIFSMRLRTQG